VPLCAKVHFGCKQPLLGALHDEYPLSPVIIWVIDVDLPLALSASFNILYTASALCCS
jgi:hypothetical protein